MVRAARLTARAKRMMGISAAGKTTKLRAKSLQSSTKQTPRSASSCSASRTQVVRACVTENSTCATSAVSRLSTSPLARDSWIAGGSDRRWA